MPNKREYTEMTADAKVGLLLGLVLIAFIAFAINGIPDFVHSIKEKPVVETAVTTQTGGNMVIDPAVVDAAKSLQQGRTTLHYVQPPSQVMRLDTSVGDLNKSITQNGQSAPNGNLTAEAPTSTLPLTQPQITPQPSSGNTISPATAAETSQASPTVVVAVGSREQQPHLINKEVEQAAQAARQTVQQMQPQALKDNTAALKTQPKTAVGATHVVQSGESLAAIAKQYYGPEGSKRATIQMLYEANKGVLESPDKIQVGDQLVIPKVKSAPASPVLQKTSAKTESAGTLLEKFKNVFVSEDKKADKKNETTTVKSSVAASKTQPAATDKKQTTVVKKAPSTAAVSEYTVQSGDYLYKIAQKFLGDGERYPEIIQLNSNTLPDSKHLVVGMKLQIPKR
jgi:nucleoid-associated protein YgaU